MYSLAHRGHECALSLSSNLTYPNTNNLLSTIVIACVTAAPSGPLHTNTSTWIDRDCKHVIVGPIKSMAILSSGAVTRELACYRLRPFGSCSSCSDNPCLGRKKSYHSQIWPEWRACITISSLLESLHL
jgi:hypothetical protein